MRIKFSDGSEFQISGIPSKGNSVAGGRYVSKQGVMCKGVEDITTFKTLVDENGNEYQSEIMPEVIEVVPEVIETV